MKIEFLEISKPEPDLNEMVLETFTGSMTYMTAHNVWAPVIAKVDKKYAQEVGLQMKRQMEAFGGVQVSLEYKFECVADVFLLEGCWITDAVYADLGYIVLTIRFDNAIQFDGVDFLLT